ncbi:precorrin-6A/cobalt-precorrin-6A reductase, partial [Litorisediminicola beolgyonensis]
PGARAFLAVGRASLPEFRGLRGPIHLRMMETPRRKPALSRVRPVPGAGPFDARGEERLFRRLGIDWLVLRNAGGPGSWPKLEAARRMGLPVAMVDRPRRPEGPRVETVEEALRWLTLLTLSDV